MRTETVPVIVGALGLIREGMDQNLGKIPGPKGLVDSVPPWYSPLKPKPAVYEANNA